MQALRKRRTLSSVAFRSSLRSFRRSPIAAEVRAISARWAKPISPMPTAAELWLKCSSCSPTQTRSPAAPPPMWQLALIQEIGLSKPCSSYSSVLAKSLAIREKSSSRRSMLLRRLISLSARDSPDTSPPHPTLMTRVYEHLFAQSSESGDNFAPTTLSVTRGLRAHATTLFTVCSGGRRRGGRRRGFGLAALRRR